MLNIIKKEPSPKEKRLAGLKEEIRNCERMIKRARMMFEMSDDENLIEARIYELKGLSKHYDYLIRQARRLENGDDESKTVNMQVVK